VQSIETWLNAQELVIMNCRLNSDVIVLNGTIDNWPAQSLLDSGASGNFLTRRFVDEAKIPTTQIQSKSVRLANGKMLTANEAAVNLEVNVKGKSVKCSFIVLEQLNNGNDAILGIPWLEVADPTISFKHRTISWKDDLSQTINNLHVKSPISSQVNQITPSESVRNTYNSKQLSKRLKRVRSTLSQKQRNTAQANLLPLDLNSLKKSEIWINTTNSSSLSNVDS
jgi:hypothetical protein